MPIKKKWGGSWTAGSLNVGAKVSWCLSIALLLAAVLGSTPLIWGAALDELITAAKKEGTLNLHAPAALSPQGAKDLIAAFNRKYGVDIRVNYIPSNSFTADIAKVVSQAALGVPPEWDLMLVSDNHHTILWHKKLHLPFDYKALVADPRSVEHDNGSVAFAHSFSLPSYNNKLLPAKDVPRKWDDLLDPKWKDGKLGVSSSVHHWAQLASGPWGEKKTTEFVKSLAKQKPFLGRLAELSTRLQLGEIMVAAMLSDSQTHVAQERGAPIVFAEQVQPVVASGYNAGVLKGARYPNTAYLFVVFMVTPEAQAVWEKYRGQTSAFVAGTRSYNFAKSKQVLYMAARQAEFVDRLSEEYSKILGFKN